MEVRCTGEVMGGREKGVSDGRQRRGEGMRGLGGGEERRDSRCVGWVGGGSRWAGGGKEWVAGYERPRFMTAQCFRESTHEASCRGRIYC